MIKSIIRKIIPEKHWEYLSWYRSNFGFASSVYGYLRLLLNSELSEVPTPFPNGKVFLRPGSTDLCVYDQMFNEKEYDLNLGNPQFIIDAGAHIGLSSVFFASKYPNATIIAIEPEPSNFDILQRNARNYPQIKPINAGLWSRSTFLCIQDSNVDTWSFRVVEDPTGKGIPAISIGDIMSKFGAKNIDVLKIDIEGSEIEILNKHHDWLDSVQILFIELHDRFQPGCTEALRNALNNYSYDESVSGESIVIRNLHKK